MVLSVLYKANEKHISTTRLQHELAIQSLGAGPVRLRNRATVLYLERRSATRQ
jgi:hypothetical protein